MTDYKTTLNLPATDFPMKANLPNREPDILKSWAQHSVFQKALDQVNNIPGFMQGLKEKHHLSAH